VQKPADPVDLSRVTTYPLAARSNKVRVDEFARRVSASSSLGDFLDGLPDVLAVKVLRELAAAIVQARAEGHPVVVAAGAHVVKAGLSPVLIAMMEEGAVSALAMTGAGAIHDWEIAAIGATAEDVGRSLHEGRHGMADETGRALNEAAKEAAASGLGFGEVLGRRISEGGLPHRESSLLARAHELGIPATVHVAIGADTVHQHPSADGAAIGAATFTDFRKLASLVGTLAGGVWINVGSAVQLPETFLKALSIAINLGHDVSGFSTANFDRVRHYRTDENVLRRPTMGRGRSFSLTGHHELTLPLLAAAVGLERARRDSGR
jgi:deoxyhypusine synthase